MTKEITISKVLEEFEDNFMEYSRENENTLIDNDTDGNDIKNFIRQSLTALIDSAPSECKKFPDIESDFYDDGYRQKCQEINKWKEEVKK